MRIKDWTGIALLFQAAGLLPLHAVISKVWIVASAVAGGLGLLLLVIRPRASNHYDPTIAPDGDLSFGSELDGGASSLLDRLSDHQ